MTYQVLRTRSYLCHLSAFPSTSTRTVVYADMQYDVYRASPSAWWRQRKSSHCIRSLLGLHLFCFWSYNVDYHC